MAAVYNLEPQPTAKVLLTTTSGDLLLELFAKQIPLASRNFLQHCLDGYYNGTIFHRLVPNFIIQGGDPTNTGHGGEAIYPGGTFEDEFHSRLKWNRRGLLGMANGGGKNDNGSQFFLTLGETRELEGRNTLFGRVVGDTIFNLVKMGDAELGGEEGSERPLYPTRVTGCEVLVNPFEDMVRREVKLKGEVCGREAKEGKKGKKKAAKVLLSFGEEGEEGAGETVLKKEKFNPKLVGANGGSDEREQVQGGSKAGLSKSVKKSETNGGSKAIDKHTDKSIRRRASVSKSPPRMTKPNRELQLPLPKDEESSRSPSESPKPSQVGKVSTLLEKTNAQIADLKASMKRNTQATPLPEKKKKSALEKMIPETAMRGRKRKLGVNGDAPVDKQTMAILDAFRSKLENAPAEIETPTSPALKASEQPSMSEDKDMQNDDNDDEAIVCDLHFVPNCQSCRSWDEQGSGDAEVDDDDKGWMSHALSFEKDRLGKDLTWKKKNEEELVVIDPKEKAKDLREGQRAKKMAKMGGSTAWDRDRDRGRVPERMAGERGK